MRNIVTEMAVVGSDEVLASSH